MWNFSSGGKWFKRLQTDLHWEVSALRPPFQTRLLHGGHCPSPSEKKKKTRSVKSQRHRELTEWLIFNLKCIFVSLLPVKPAAFQFQHPHFTKINSAWRLPDLCPSLGPLLYWQLCGWGIKAFSSSQGHANWNLQDARPEGHWIDSTSSIWTKGGQSEGRGLSRQMDGTVWYRVTATGPTRGSKAQLCFDTTALPLQTESLRVLHLISKLW